MRRFLPRALAKILILESDIRSLSAEIRIFPDGSANMAAEKTFLGLGFTPDGDWRLKIRDHSSDRHFRETQEPDGFVTARRLRCGAETLRTIASC